MMQSLEGITFSFFLHTPSTTCLREESDQEELGAWYLPLSAMVESWEFHTLKGHLKICKELYVPKMGWGRVAGKIANSFSFVLSHSCFYSRFYEIWEHCIYC